MTDISLLSDEDRATDRKRKLVYWTSFISALIVLEAAWILLLCAIQFTTKIKVSGGGGGIMVPLTGVAATFTTARCRSKGLSLARQTLEILPAPRSGADLPTVTVQASASAKKGIAGAFAGLALLIFVRVRTVPSIPGTEIIGYATAVFMALCAGAFWMWSLNKRSFAARADADGITDQDTLKHKLVPWEQIASCETTTTYNALGICQRRRLVLTLEAGKDTVVDLSQADYRQSETLIAHLRKRCAPRR